MIMFEKIVYMNRNYMEIGKLIHHKHVYKFFGITFLVVRGEFYD